MTTRLRSEAGFTLVEMLVATGLLLVISSIVTSALLQMTNHQQTIWNRTEMHSGVRGATELLQQEVGQAGRVTLPGATGAVTLTLPIVTAAGTLCTMNVPTAGVLGVPVTATVSSTLGMFVGEWLTTLDGDAAETVAITAITSATTLTACFTQSHLAATTKLRALGGFSSGIVAPSLANGSTANRLKLYGDVNGDGTMVYIEYYCDNGDPGTNGTFNLYRNVVQPFVPFGTAAVVKPAVDGSMVLLAISTRIPRTRGSCTSLLRLPGAGARHGAGRRRHADRMVAVARPDHETIPDRNEGAPERLATQRVLHLGVCGTQLHEPHSADARGDHAAAALKRPEIMQTHNQRGIALVLALFLMSALSVLGASLMFLSQTETYASMNYRMMSQARYAAEAGIQKASNFLLDPTQYAAPTVADLLALAATAPCRP